MSRVLAWHADPGRDGSAFYRIFTPLEALAEAPGPHEIRLRSILREEDVTWSNVTLAQRIADISAMSEWARLAAQDNGPRLVIDVDDDLFSISPDSPAAPAYGRTEQTALRMALGCSHHVVASTEPLAQRMREYHPDVRVAPNCVPGWLLKRVRTVHEERPVIGWAGSATHAEDIATIAPAIEALSERLGTSAAWRTAGGHRFPISRSAGGYLHDPWIPSVRDYLMRFTIDIGIIPLADTEFNQSKSDVKAREFAAMGTPVVAADHPVYRNTVRHGVTGFLYRTPEEMAGYVRELVDDYQLRAGMSSRARRYAGEHFVITKQGNLDAWQAAIMRKGI